MPEKEKNMENYERLNGRDKLIKELTEMYLTKSAESIILIQANRGQGKSYVINKLIEKMPHKEITILLSCVDELQTIGGCEKTKNINTVGFTAGIASASIGFSVGWNNLSSQYEKVKNILSSYLKKDILICIDNIEEISDELRCLIIQIIGNIERLENEYHKKIFVLITSALDIQNDVIFKCNSSQKLIKLPNYDIIDVEIFLKAQKKLLTFDIKKIYTLCQGNLNLTNFIYKEMCIENNNYLDTLSDVVNRKLDILKFHGEQEKINGYDIEDIIFSASLALKNINAQLLNNIIEKNVPLIQLGLDIACQESLLEKDLKRYYAFISDEVQNKIAEITIKRREDLLLSYYNYYTHNEPDEYYIRAYYIYKYRENLTDLSETLFLLAYFFAKKMFDNQKVEMIEELFLITNKVENIKFNFMKIKKFCNDIESEVDLSIISEDFEEIQKSDFDITVLAEASCEYFGILYRKHEMNTTNVSHVLNNCIGYAENELFIDCNEINGIYRTDEKILRLKIIYEIAPYILDEKNDYDAFQKLYNLSKELNCDNNISKRQKSLGEYIENVFNRKAFLFVNQASCDIYYEKAKKYFSKHEIWLEYYITLVCQAGTYIVIQEFEKAIQICESIRKECEERQIILPQIEKLYNNEAIAEFLLAEKNASTIKKAQSASKKTLTKLKKLINGDASSAQFVIYTNICSLCLYSDDRKQYYKYKKQFEKIYKCKNLADIMDEGIDDFYRYYFAWFELYCAISDENWDDAEKIANSLNDFVPALFRKQEIFWTKKLDAAKALIKNKTKQNAYYFCNNLVKTQRQEQILSKFFYRGLMLSDLQYTSYF